MPADAAPPPDVTVAELADHFRQFGEITARKLPLYRRLCLGAAEDPEVVARLFLARPEQQRVVLVLAAVHDVLLAGDGSPLGEWYGSVVTKPRPVGDGEDDPWPHFRDLALRHPGVAQRLATRSTQTNEVGRCATLLPAFAGIADDTDRPLGLLEVGASAGLNLLLDRYHYHYEPGGDVGGPSPVRLRAKVWGDRPLPVPASMPAIASRVGLDLQPVDLTDPIAARWLVACQWPDQLDRIERVRAAIEVAAGDPPSVVAGDAIEAVPPLIQAMPEWAIPVLFSTWVMAFLPDDRQRAFISMLGKIGATRDLSYVFSETSFEAPGLPIPTAPGASDDPHVTALVRVDWRKGRRAETRLADQHPHGAWITWLA